MWEYLFFPETEGSSCWFSGIVLSEGRRLEDAKRLSGMLKEKGIESRTFWKPVHLQKPYKDASRLDVGTVGFILGTWNSI